MAKRTKRGFRIPTAAAVKADIDAPLKRVADLEACVQELVDAIKGLRDNVTKASLELLPPASRMAVDLALVHAKRLGAKGLETDADRATEATK